MKSPKGNPAINYCILIPTYNNEKTLEKVILSVLEHTSNVIVVNDGSDDDTENILERFKSRIETISYPENRGKGAAIREGLQRAAELGYEYAITLDSDGQHYPAEISKFLEKVRPGERILIIGNRDMSDAHIPPRSLFGRKFSNFWVKLETGKDLKDTQSGFRLYTVAPMNRIHFLTVKYDFELEALVRWVWHDYPVETVDIRVYYPAPEERVSHFKGFKDNFRISVLNTVLVTITGFFIIPRRIIRAGVSFLRKIF